MPHYPRRHDDIDLHIELRERIRKLETMSSSLTMRPREWAARETYSGSAVTSLVIALSAWDIRVDINGGRAVLPYPYLDRITYQIYQELLAEGWGSVAAARQWTQFLQACGAVPFLENIGVSQRLPNSYWDRWEPVVPQPVSGTRLPFPGAPPETGWRGSYYVTMGYPTGDALVPSVRGRAKFAVWTGVKPGRWTFTEAGTKYAPNAPPVPGEGLTIPHPDPRRAPIEVVPAGSYVYYPTRPDGSTFRSAPAQYVGNEDAAYYAGATDANGNPIPVSCENLERNGYRDYAHYDEGDPAGIASASWHQGGPCEANLVDHTPITGTGADFVYEYLPAGFAYLVAPPVPWRGQETLVNLRGDLDYNTSYPGWDDVRTLVEHCVQYFPAVQDWVAGKVEKYRPRRHPKWYTLPVHPDVTGTVEAQVKDRYVFLRGRLRSHRPWSWLGTPVVYWTQSVPLPMWGWLENFEVLRAVSGRNKAVILSMRSVHIFGAQYWDWMGITVDQIDGAPTEIPSDADVPGIGVIGLGKENDIIFDGVSFPVNYNLY